MSVRLSCVLKSLCIFDVPSQKFALVGICNFPTVLDVHFVGWERKKEGKKEPVYAVADGFRGIETKKLVPIPTADSTRMDPPTASAHSAAIARPKPDPRTLRSPSRS